MAIRKKGSRRIVVDGVNYRWRIRHRGTYSQIDYGWGRLHVSVQSEVAPGANLWILSDHPHPHDIATEMTVPIQPSDVAKWVRESIKAGWEPQNPGPTFILRCGENSKAL